MRTEERDIRERDSLRKCASVIVGAVVVSVLRQLRTKEKQSEDEKENENDIERQTDRQRGSAHSEYCALCTLTRSWHCNIRLGRLLSVKRGVPSLACHYFDHYYRACCCLWLPVAVALEQPADRVRELERDASIIINEQRQLRASWLWLRKDG